MQVLTSNMLCLIILIFKCKHAFFPYLFQMPQDKLIFLRSMVIFYGHYSFCCSAFKPWFCSKVSSGSAHGIICSAGVQALFSHI